MTSIITPTKTIHCEENEVYIGNNVYKRDDTFTTKDKNKLNFNDTLRQMNNKKSKVLNRVCLETMEYRMSELLSKDEFCELHGLIYNEDGTGLDQSNHSQMMWTVRKCVEQYYKSNFDKNTEKLKSINFPIDMFYELFEYDYRVVCTKKTGQQSSWVIEGEAKLYVKRTMDLETKLTEYFNKVRDVEQTTEYTEYMKPEGTNIDICSIYMFNRYVSDSTILRQRIDNKLKGGYIMPKSKTEIRNGIEVMFVRGTKNVKGHSMPNRIFKAADKEGLRDNVDNPYSSKGQCNHLRSVLRDNKVKRFTKLNKAEMVEKLLKL